MTPSAPFSTSVVDCETDDLKYKILHCIVVRCVDTLQEQRFVNRKSSEKSGVEWNPDWLDIEEFPDWARARIKNYIAHNGLCFDFQVFEDLLGFKIHVDHVIDTLVISRLFMPQRENGHSLEAWGVFLGCPKSKFEDFADFSLEMLEYCSQDTTVNVKVWRYLEQENQKWNFSSMSIRLEHDVRAIMWEQEKHGFYLDRAKATTLLSDTARRLREVEKEMYSVFVPQPVHEKNFITKYKKDKSISSVGLKPVLNALKEVGWKPETYLVGQPIAHITMEDFNLGSPQQVAARLLEIGWRPKNLTPGGRPKIDEESLEPFAKDFPQVGLLSEYLMVRSRNSLAEQWLDAVDKKGYVHGRVNTMGAITGRMTHQDPNMANVPAASDAVPYGKDCRACWTVEDKENYRLVGCDASSLELRMLCHYMDDEEYTRAAVSGDIHAMNMKAFKLCEDPILLKAQDPKLFKELRDISKRLLYAILYGAGNKKVGTILGASTKKGEEIKENLFTGIPKFGKLIEWVSEQSRKNQYVYGLDGRRIWTRSEHAALNTLLQGGGAIVCKAWMCYIHQMAKKAGLDFQQLCQIHDEMQYQVHKDHVEAFGAITKAAMKKVEDILKLKCPLDSEWKAGENWQQTH